MFQMLQQRTNCPHDRNKGTNLLIPYRCTKYSTNFMSKPNKSKLLTQQRRRSQGHTSSPPSRSSFEIHTSPLNVLPPHSTLHFQGERDFRTLSQRQAAVTRLPRLLHFRTTGLEPDGSSMPPAQPPNPQERPSPPDQPCPTTSRARFSTLCSPDSSSEDVSPLHCSLSVQESTSLFQSGLLPLHVSQIRRHGSRSTLRYFLQLFQGRRRARLAAPHFFGTFHGKSIVSIDPASFWPPSDTGD